MRRWTIGPLIAVALTVGACSSGTDNTDTNPPGVTNPEKAEGQSEFNSPGSNRGGPGRYGAGAENDASAGAQPGTPAPAEGQASGGTAPPRELEESDIFKWGNDAHTLLFVLNQYRGLQVIDLADLDHPRVVGHAPIFGYPKEMYVRDGRAYVVVSDYYSFWRNPEAMDGMPYAYYGSQLRVLDVSDPTLPRVIGSLDILGEATDSRIVGDVLYVVAQRYAWYDRYDSTDNVTKSVVLSVDISDPANIRAVEHLDFPQGGWEQHIAVNQNAIYVSASGWDQGAYGYQTKIDYVDISDPAGHIARRGEVQVTGRVMDRWSMDEYQNVLRVASGTSWGNGDIFLTTFDVADPDHPSQLGQAVLHVNENLTSARFDGARGYLVSYKSIDPLFTFDLSDAAHPRLLDELVMTGWLDFMVPMGDRIVALGHEDVTVNNERTISLAVSLIAVPEGDRPTLLSRVALDGWGWVPGSRDDFAKVFKVLSEEGLVMFPFQSWSRTDWRYIGGVKLIDYTRDALTGRGLIQDAGWVERAIPDGPTTVLTLSNEVFQVMNIADRDHPLLRGRLELARNVQDFAALPGGMAVQLSGDWYMGDTSVTVTPLLDPDTATPSAKLHVPAPYGRMFVNGSFAYVASMRQDDPSAPAATRVQVLDLTNPATPRVRGELVLPEQVWLGYRSWYWGWGDEVEQIGGSMLAFHRFRYNWCMDYGADCTSDQEAANAHKIYLADFADPDHPRLVSTISLDSAAWAWGMRAFGSMLTLSEYRSYRDAATESWYTRYYLRRVDISNPSAPVVLDPVNIPGMLVGMSADGVYAYTMENWWDDGAQRQTARLYTLAIVAGRAYLRSSVDFQGYVNNAIVSGTTAYVSTNYGETIAVAEGGQRWVNHSELVTVSLDDPRAMRVAGRASIPYDWAYLQKVKGGRAFVGSGAGIFSYIVTDPAAPLFEGFFRTQGWSEDLLLVGSKLFVTAGYYGVQIIDLAPGH